MFQKIANVLSIISFVMVASMSGGTYFAYKYVTSEQFKSRVMNEILDNVSGMMPKVLEETNQAILMIEGGVQAKEMLLKKIESSDQPTGIVELGQESEKAPSKK